MQADFGLILQKSQPVSAKNYTVPWRKICYNKMENMNFSTILDIIFSTQSKTPTFLEMKDD